MTEAGGARPGARPVRLWDVALSFAGAQRYYVEQVAQALKARGVRCFYDADEEIELWGKYLAEELPVIYGEQAAAVVVFVSAQYVTRDWTRLERRAALARAARERREYVLPARFDDTPLPGLLPDMVVVDLRGRAPQQFADMIAGKLAALGVTALTRSAEARGPATQVCGEGSRASGATQKAAEPVHADNSQGETEHVIQSIADERVPDSRVMSSGHPPRRRGRRAEEIRPLTTRAEVKELRDLIIRQVPFYSGDFIPPDDPCPCGSGQKFEDCRCDPMDKFPLASERRSTAGKRSRSGGRHRRPRAGSPDNIDQGILEAFSRP
jgi:hypothetical protein